MNKFISSGLSSLTPTQIIETVLIYSAPDADFLRIANELAGRFQDIRGVLLADPDELRSIEGIDDNTLTLIRLISQIYNYCRISEAQGLTVRNTSELKDMFVSMFGSVKQEQAVLACLDDKMTIRKICVISEGNESSVEVDVNEIIGIVSSAGCNICAVAHNHPDFSSTPSESDIIATSCLRSELKKSGITLLEHIVVGNDGAKALISGELEHFFR